MGLKESLEKQKEIQDAISAGDYQPLEFQPPVIKKGVIKISEADPLPSESSVQLPKAK